MTSTTRRVTAKEAKEEISSLLNEIEGGGTIEVTVRGKAIARLGSPHALEENALLRAKRIAVSDIKQGKRNFTGVLVHGPYVITRRGEDVASLKAAPEAANAAAQASPQQHIVNLLERQVSNLEELRLLKEEHKRARNLRQRLDKAIKDRIQLLRNMGENAAADGFEVHFRELDMTQGA